MSRSFVRAAGTTTTTGRIRGSRNTLVKRYSLSTLADVGAPPGIGVKNDPGKSRRNRDRAENRQNEDHRAPRHLLPAPGGVLGDQLGDVGCDLYGLFATDSVGSAGVVTYRAIDQGALGCLNGGLRVMHNRVAGQDR